MSLIPALDKFDPACAKRVFNFFNHHDASPFFDLDFCGSEITLAAALN